MTTELVGREAYELLTDTLSGLSEGCAVFDEDSQMVVCNDLFRTLNASISEFLQPGIHWETMLREVGCIEVCTFTNKLIK